jgi:hypothetical protein
LDGLSFIFVGVKEQLWLEKAMKESEVVEVVRALNGDKAPSLDWFFFFSFSKLVGGGGYLKWISCMSFRSFIFRGSLKKESQCNFCIPYPEKSWGC